jgi:hypothetical protein
LANELRSALNKIRAEDALKRKTSEFLRAEIAKRERGDSRFRPRLAAVCAIALFCMIGGFSVYFTPAAYIDFDVNPSVGLAVNRLGIVIAAAAYNDDGTSVLQNVKVKNKTYGEAAKTLMDAFISGGYLSENGLVSATVQTKGKDYENNLLDTLTAVVNLSLANHHISAETDLFPVDAELMSAAHGHRLTPAKYLAITELQAVDPTATFEGCAEHDIGEIRGLINAHDGEHHSEDNTESDRQSNSGAQKEHATDDGGEENKHHDESGNGEQPSFAPLQDQNSGHRRKKSRTAQ